jgi:hypothetical protein
MIRRSVVIVLLCIAGAAGAQKQDTSSVCVRGRSLAKCKSWVMIGATVELPLPVSLTDPPRQEFPEVNTYTYGDFRPRVGFTVGMMGNVTGSQAGGAMITFFNSGFGRIEGRYRRWLEPAAYGLDVSAGFVRGRVDGRGTIGELTTGGVTGSAGISAAYFGVDVRVDRVKASRGGNGRVTYVSFRFGT